MSVHEGHRERLKARYLEHGLENFNELNTLELLLFYAIPRKDTNPVAHALLERFGNLAGVLEASIEELMTVPGMGASAAALISLLPQVMKKCAVMQGKEVKCINDSTDAGSFLVPKFLCEHEELLLMVCLDGRRRIICCRELGRGGINSVEVNARKIVEMALKSHAESVLLAHNHPNGFALPSMEDESATASICNALKLVGVTLVDHIVISGDDYVSFADSGLLHRS